MIGMIFMAETIAQLVFQIPGGVLTDRIGRKKMIIIGSGPEAWKAEEAAWVPGWTLVPRKKE